jgi:hypothetical protein
MSIPKRFGTGQLMAGGGVLAFMGLMAVARLIDPAGDNLGDARLDIADVTAHPAAFLASTVLVLGSTIGVAAAAAGLWRLAVVNQRRLAVAGAILIGLGALGNAALITFNGFLYEMRGGDPTEMVALLERVNSGAVLLMVFPLLLALALGFVLWSISLWRAGIVPLGCVVGIFLISVGDFLGGSVPGGGAITTVLLVIVYGWLAIVLLRLPASAWADASSPAVHPVRAPIPA